MGYRVIYGEDPFVKPKRETGHLRLWTAGFALAFVILVRCFWPRGTELLQQVLLPGDMTAFAQMTEEIRAGESVGDAVTAFCRSVVEEAIGEAD